MVVRPFMDGAIRETFRRVATRPYSNNFHSMMNYQNILIISCKSS
jgi:hypothetical protein